MDPIKQHFDEEARQFDQTIQQLVPYYNEMLHALVLSIPFDRGAPIQVLDLGCGTGTVSQHILQAFPQAQVTCLDFSDQMIAMAQAKLAGDPRATFLVQDFQDYHLAGPYHAVVSSLALHHLATDADKQALYQKIYTGLRPGGCFFNADVVLASDEYLQAVYMQRWEAYMRRQLSAEEVANTWHKYLAEDRPAQLLRQLSWLASMGFQGVDVVWKYYNFAVYGGIKP